MRIFPAPPQFTLVSPSENGNMEYRELDEDLFFRLVRHHAVQADTTGDVATYTLSAHGRWLVEQKGTIEAATVLPELFPEDVPYGPMFGQMEEH